jgi:UDPglucose 6-dehydrogenase
MRSFKVVTSQNKKYYDLIGRDCILSFLEHWPQNVCLELWAEEFVPDITNDRLILRPFDTVKKNLDEFYQDLVAVQPQGRHVTAYKFYLKAHVVLETWRDFDSDVFVWLDSDILTRRRVPFEFLDRLCPPDCLAVDVPHGGKGWQREADTGLFMLNMQHPAKDAVIDFYREYHTTHKIFQTYRNIETSVWWSAVEVQRRAGHKVNHLDITWGEPDSFKTTVLENYMTHYINTQKHGRKKPQRTRKMKIGVIGVGAVGSACRQGFALLGHEVSVHDPKFDTTIDDVIDTEVAYVCVPTPAGADGSCDLSAVKETIQALESRAYAGVVALKSTSEPGTTESLLKDTNLRMCFVPEFLRERAALEDFVVNHELLVVGTHDQDIYDTVVASHGFFPKNRVMMTPTEAEILKYYSNTFNALRVVFANAMYEICHRFGADYAKVKDTYLIRGTASGDYLDCNERVRGYGGMCLPKDVKAIDAVIKKYNLGLDLFQAVDHDNQQFKRTVFPGMRP